jgi:precorrin-8X/cobalt-precorrin-8 methylmutase
MIDKNDWNLPPDEIEQRSFAIIDREAPVHDWGAAWPIIRRMVHTSADFEYVSSVRIHPRAIEAGLSAIRQGKPIITDTRMVEAGISKKRLEGFGCPVGCLIDHPDVIQTAKESGATRASAAVDLALTGTSCPNGSCDERPEGRLAGGIYVIGNAPTALFRLIEQVAGGKPAPALVIGLPVGFVNAAESKEALLSSSLVYLTNVGRKGGSNVAAGVVNALVRLAHVENGDALRG